MKFSVSSSELLRQLQVASGAIGSSPVLPILEDFLFTIQNKKLTITATDLETSISTTMDVLADDDFAVAVPAKILLETLKALPQQPITFSVDEEKFGIEITSSYGKYKLAGEKSNDFPEIPQPDSVDTVKLSSKFLIEAINKTVFATSNDDLRPAMTGVYFQVDFNKLTCVATDAHKLVKYNTHHLAGEVATTFIVPKKVIPVDNPNKMQVNRGDFQNSLKRIAIYANKTTNQVVLDIADKSLNISAQDLDFSNEAAEQMSCNYEGDPIRIAFNAKFLIEMLGVLDTEEVQVELSKPSRAGILTPIEENTEREILMLVMPVMLNN
ncbi:MAG: DNA polymerase III subunit beta [Lewinellaceae bacterium]|nr:DNA polymerase III subunit beta [Lewinellaceae bacterium]